MLSEYELKLIKLFSISVILISTISLFFTANLWNRFTIIEEITFISFDFVSVLAVIYLKSKNAITIFLIIAIGMVIIAFWYAHSLGAYLSAHHFEAYNSTCESNSTMFYCVKDGIYGSFIPINSTSKLSI